MIKKVLYFLWNLHILKEENPDLFLKIVTISLEKLDL